MKLKCHRILVKVGDKVEAEQSLITVEGRQSLYGSPVSAGWRREKRSKFLSATKTGTAPVMIFDLPTAAADAAPAKAEEKKQRLRQQQHLLRQRRKDAHVPDIGSTVP